MDGAGAGGREAQTPSFSHAFSLSSALPRCEILFFAALSISAYVWPSYSNAESHPRRKVSYHEQQHTADSSD